MAMHPYFHCPAYRLFSNLLLCCLAFQIENEYDHVREAFKEDAERYIQWAGQMALSQNTGVPWIMCKQKDAPGDVVNTFT